MYIFALWYCIIEITLTLLQVVVGKPMVLLIATEHCQAKSAHNTSYDVADWCCRRFTKENRRSERNILRRAGNLSRVSFPR